MSDSITLTPTKVDWRCAFAVAWYPTEREADVAGRIVRERGDTANGGWFHGTPLGRDPSFDGQHGFAVLLHGSAPEGEAAP